MSKKRALAQQNYYMIREQQKNISRTKSMMLIKRRCVITKGIN